MNRLKDILKKQPSELTDEKKALLLKYADLLTDDQKAKFLDGEGDDEKEPEDDSDEDSDEESDDADVSETEVKELVNKHIQDQLSQMADKASDQIVSKFMKGVDTARAKAAAGKKVKTNKSADENTREFMKAILKKDFTRAKALTTNDDVNGADPDDAAAGVTIPEELQAEVLRVAQTQFGLARRDMRYLPFSGPGNSRKIPALGTGVIVTWTGEGAKKGQTQPKFRLVEQTLKKLTAIVPMTEEILEDTAIPLTSLIAELVAEAVTKEEDIEFFAGTGSPWTGIINNTSVNIVDQESGGSADLTADDLLDMIDATPTAALNGAKFYMNRRTFSKVRKLKDLNGAYIYSRPQDNTPAQIWDYPYELTDALPVPGDVEDGDSYIIFGNLQKGCILGDKQQLRVKALDQATITDTDGTTQINLAEQDMVALRFVERVGYLVALPEVITKLRARSPSSSDSPSASASSSDSPSSSSSASRSPSSSASPST